ncbi:hypothetical protein EGW08_007225 [Elysia chlorotica]|uniref:EGF-like domain-containing protein n=1 Tax=Elysia chlorotica TaxID=188477 RepID=A0A3S1A833_ELYCH|nr:hypothetical protein EGW08_007225 [Elysia chlorotica]
MFDTSLAPGDHVRPKQQLRLQVVCDGGHHRTTLATDMYFSNGNTSQGLVTHPEKRLVFYIAGQELLSRWMDGTNRALVHKQLGVSASGLSLDIPTERLYWAANGQGSEGEDRLLYGCDLDGSNLYPITKTGIPVLFMDVFEGLAYTSDPTTRCVHTFTTYGATEIPSSAHHNHHNHNHHPGHLSGHHGWRDRQRNLHIASRFMTMVMGRTCQGMASLREFPHPGPVRDQSWGLLVFYIAGQELLSRWMDGTNRALVHKQLGVSASGLSLDVPTDRLYWAANGQGSEGEDRLLYGCDLDGSNMYPITKTGIPVLFMDVFEGLAYTSDPTTRCVHTFTTYGATETPSSAHHNHHNHHPGHLSGHHGWRDRQRNLHITSRFMTMVMGRTCQGMASLREFPHPGPVRVVHELKQLKGQHLSPAFPPPLSPLKSTTTTSTASTTAHREITLPATGRRRVTAKNGRRGHGRTSTTSTSLASSSSSSFPSLNSTATPPQSWPLPDAEVVETCDQCSDGGTCLNATGRLVCLCKDGHSCVEDIEKQPNSLNKGDKHLTWIPVVVVAVTVLLILVTVALGCYFRKKKNPPSLMTTISFKNPNFAVKNGDKDNLARVSFGGSFFKEEEVDEEADYTLDDDWWRRLLARSRVTLDSSTRNKPPIHRSISTVEEEEEEEEEEGEVEEQVKEVGRRGRGVKISSFLPGSGTGKDPQILETSDKSRLLV